MKRTIYMRFRAGIISMAILCTGILSFLTVSAQDITTGLILHYTFEDITGTTVEDQSGNGNTGILRGGAVSAEGFSGQGVTCLNKPDYIEAPDNINIGLTSFTFATWVKLTALKNATRYFDWGNGENGTNNFIAFIPSFNTDDGYMTLRFRPPSGTAYNVTSASKCPTGSWAHVAVSFSWGGTSGTATIYLNGEPVGTGSVPLNPHTFLGNTADNYFGYSRWAQDGNGFGGTFDDIRIYNRALTDQDIIMLAGLDELHIQYELLDLGDLSSVTENIILPAELGDKGVTVTWTTSNYTVIDASGNVTRPEKYDRSVKLTATLSYLFNGMVFTLDKTFVARVKGMVELPEQLCKWTFDNASLILEGNSVIVKDRTSSALTGRVMNDAVIRTIGNTNRYNVLYLGDGTGYFDMGTEIGEAIYALNDHTIMCYFRVDSDYAALSADGNFLYAFSNTQRGDTDQTGYVIGRLNNTSHQCTKYYWGNGKMEIAVGSTAGRGSWHHYAYVQEGTTGKIYIDGILRAQGSMTQLPSTDIALSGRTGTLYNWLGRSIGLPTDTYLRKTMIYDFNVYSTALSAVNLTVDHAVPDTLAMLNTAYAENPDYKSQELLHEFNQLSLGDLSSVISNLDLPVTGSTYPDVSIEWHSSKPEIISSAGTVNRPDYLDYDITLTATLSYGLYSMVKIFPATVLANEGTTFSGDLVVRFDFSNLEGSTVKDVAEKQFPGTLMYTASVVTMGTGQTGIYNVLDLGKSTGYFDMGTEVGKVVSRLNDFTIGAFYRIEETYTGLGNAGNFIWNFSNSDNALSARNGYLIGSLQNQSVSITPGYYAESSGNQSVSFERPALKGNWHHIAYTQKDHTGTIYIDGNPIVSSAITNLPSSSLDTEGLPGTPYNWLGRSCYIGDAYLRNTLVYDFRIYKKALTEKEIRETEMNVTKNLGYLEAAYHACIADSKTDETEIMQIPERPEPTVLKIFNDDNASVRINLDSIARISFTDTETIIMMNSGNIRSFMNDNILKMVFDSVAVSVGEVFHKEGMTLYPNPASGFIVLEVPDQSAGEIKIYSVTGKLMLTEKVHTATLIIDISLFPEGIYIVKSGHRTAKFLKK